MEKIAIVCDSCGDIDKTYIDEYDIRILPMIIDDGNKIYRDGIDIQVEDIYEKLKQDVTLKTSLPSLNASKFTVAFVANPAFVA